MTDNPRIEIERISQDTWEVQFNGSGSGQYATERAAKQSASRQFSKRLGGMRWDSVPNGKLRAYPRKGADR
jgi:hypothetical protein